jgi:hypothetical protein
MRPYPAATSYALKRRHRWPAVGLLLAVVWLAVLSAGCREQTQRAPRSGLTPLQVLEDAFHNRESNLQVTQRGEIVKLLPDDTKGSRHQRMIVELASGQTLLIAHNIDLAPRLPALETGETLTFHGEYEWNEHGGVIHWTHHDPDGRHEAGWVKYRGKTYQ